MGLLFDFLDFDLVLVGAGGSCGGTTLTFGVAETGAGMCSVPLVGCTGTLEVMMGYTALLEGRLTAGCFGAGVGVTAATGAEMTSDGVGDKVSLFILTVTGIFTLRDELLLIDVAAVIVYYYYVYSRDNVLYTSKLIKRIPVLKI